MPIAVIRTLRVHSLRTLRVNVATRGIHVFNSISALRAGRKQMNGSLGFVPTMGALHQGHLSLAQQALKENDNVVVSIFINPTQFSAGEDLDKYPKKVEQDLAMLTDIGIKHVFVPERADLLKPDSLCRVEAPAFNNIYEGNKRPEFFRGVATIVCKLFNIVQPDVAYFGQKDISQFIMLRSMVEDLNMPVHVKCCETLREKDGLAMSSRNVYLSPSERQAASILYKALTAAGDCYLSCQVRGGGDVALVIDAARQVLSSEPLVTSVQYISVASPRNMQEVTSLVSAEEGAVISAAITIGSVRLIDNILVGASREVIFNE